MANVNPKKEFSIAKIEYFRGFLHTKAQSLVRFHFVRNQGGIPKNIELVANIERMLRGAVDATQFKESPPNDYLELVAWVVSIILNHVGWPLSEEVALNRSRDNVIFLDVPSVYGGESALTQVVRFVEILVNTDPLTDDLFCHNFDRVINIVSQEAPSGVNSKRLIDAAVSLDIPWTRLVRNVYVFGWGKYSQTLDSTFTQNTSAIAASLSRNKLETNVILARAGLPVSQSHRVLSVEHLSALLTHCRYPLVIKPFNLDGGRGVFTGLNSKKDVFHAYSKVSKLSNKVMLEKHYEGEDYRIQVYKGMAFWAVHREPAHVIGDGIHSVEQLVAISNTELDLTEVKTNRFRPIILDDDAELWLRNQNLTKHSVPKMSCKVRLRGAANVSSGGSLTPVLEVAHPDNLALAKQAVNALRLDLAGVDILMPDITESWRTSGAIICEVNAQPQISPSMIKSLLSNIMGQRTRVPIYVILGGCADSAIFSKIIASLPVVDNGFTVVDADSVSIDGKIIQTTRDDKFIHWSSVLINPSVSSVVFHIDNFDWLKSGAVVDKIDHLFVIDTMSGHAGGKDIWVDNLQLLAERSHQRWYFSETVSVPGFCDYPFLPYDQFISV